MNATTIGRQLYPASRTNLMSTDRLNAVLHLALYDMSETSGTVYDGMGRADTITTAKRTRDDILRELRIRAARWNSGENG